MGLKENTTKLNALLEKANSLPDDRFWDMHQNYGNRRNYQCAFRNWEGVKEIKPKYPIVATHIYEMFACCYELEYLPPFEIIPSTNTTYAPFMDCYKLKGIYQDIPLYGNCGNAFRRNKELETIQKIIVSSAVTNISTAFQECNKLKNVVFEGELCVSVDLQWSTLLTKASITSLINVLSPNTSGLTCTLSQTAVNDAFTNEERVELFTTKPNWTISLA